MRLNPSGSVVEKGRKRETREFDGRMFLMETALKGDIAILRAWKVDTAGNCVFRSVRISMDWSSIIDTAADMQRRPSVH